MKLTFSHFPSFWVKVVPVILVLFCIGLTSATAQNYKPLDEAAASVAAALDDLSTEKYVKASVNGAGTGGTSNTPSGGGSQSNTTQKKIFEVSYFGLFLREAKLTASVAEAVQNLDAFFAAQGQQPAARTAIYTAARADLMELITN